MSAADFSVGGRPSSFKPEYVAQTEKLCALGATDIELADFFNVDPVTIWRWKYQFPEFRKAISTAKEAADDRVERSLYNRALGYQRKAVKIFMPANAGEPVYAPYTEEVPADPASMIFWLKNRRREYWRDRHPEDSTDTTVTVKVIGGLQETPKSEPESSA